MRWSLFLRKLQAFRPANLLKKRHQHRYFPVKLARFSSIVFFTEHLRWLVFKISNSNILFKNFLGVPLRHSKSLITFNSHNDKLNLKMYSLTKNFSVTDLEQTRRDLIETLTTLLFFSTSE